MSVLCVPAVRRRVQRDLEHAKNAGDGHVVPDKDDDGDQFLIVSKVGAAAKTSPSAGPGCGVVVGECAEVGEGPPIRVSMSLDGSATHV